MPDTADSEPDLSSSAGNTPASTSHALPLDHPCIKHIWNDSRFDAVQIHHPGDIDSYGYHPEAYVLLSHPHGRDYLTSLNPLAKSFVPSFTPSNLSFINNRPAPDFFEEGRLSPLHFDSGFGVPSPNLHTLEDAQFASTPSFPPVFPMSDFPSEEQGPARWFYPSFPLHAPQNYTNFMDGETPTGHSSANARSFYPPGLPHPPQNRKNKQNVRGDTSPMDLRRHADYVAASASDPLCTTLPLAYTPLLLAALNPHLVPQDRDVFIRSAFEYIDQWDAWNLRELAVRVVVTVFGPEEQGKQREAVIAEGKPVDESSNSSSQPNEVLPPQTISVPIPDQVFFQLIVGLCTQFQVDERLGEDYKIGFLTELTNAVFRLFSFLFATNNSSPPANDTSNTEAETDTTTTPSPLAPLAYTDPALPVSKLIAHLYHHRLQHHRLSHHTVKDHAISLNHLLDRDDNNNLASIHSENFRRVAESMLTILGI